MIYHFIGIGGIGMSALARIALAKGDQVQGTDASSSALIETLMQEGARIRVGHDPSWIQPGMTIVYSSDIRSDHPERQRAQELGLPCLHRSDLLALYLREKKAILVTGTHGKTTTTALLAAVFLEARLDPSFVIGGILRDRATNGSCGRGAYFIAEADESDGSFLKSPSEAAIVTNLEPEHLDYWGDEERLTCGFRQFFQQSRAPFWCIDDPRLAALQPPGLSYGFSETADVHISHFVQSQGHILFDVTMQGVCYPAIRLALLGRHNALNGAAVYALAHSLHLPEEAIRRAFSQFSGTRRRLEKKGDVQNILIYDDYGHHPTEIAVTIRALRQEIGTRRLWVLFQPHRYTRVRDCFDLFIHAFDEVDALVITDIYAAREAPIPLISSDRLYEAMSSIPGRSIYRMARSSLEEEVVKKVQPGDVLLTIGAGDITFASERLLNLCKKFL